MRKLVELTLWTLTKYLSRNYKEEDRFGPILALYIIVLFVVLDILMILIYFLPDDIEKTLITRPFLYLMSIVILILIFIYLSTGNRYQKILDKYSDVSVERYKRYCWFVGIAYFALVGLLIILRLDTSL